MTSPYSVAAIQMVSSTKLDENLERAAYWVEQAAQRGAKLAVLPEYFCLMGETDRHKLSIAELFGSGKIQCVLSLIAEKNQIWLSSGTLPIVSADSNRVYNSSLLFSPSGDAVARYDKIHLFYFVDGHQRYCEPDTVMPGQTPTKISTELGEWAFGICYDLRFPELFRSLLPFDILILPAAFTVPTGQAHWEVLLRARAIENQCYVIAAAQGGKHANGRQTYGHSLIIDPWGQILAQLEQGEGLVLASIDPQALLSFRTRLPALKHRLLK